MLPSPDTYQSERRNAAAPASGAARTVKITRRERDAIVKSLSAGVVPTIGLQHIQVDRKDEILAMIGDLERIRDGGATVRFIVGKFGTGKSFFLNLAKAVAVAEDFVVMHADVALKKRLASTMGYARNLYAELVGGMSIKAKPDGGAMEFVIEKWIKTLSEQCESGENLLSAVKSGLNPLRDMVGGFHFAEVMTKCCEAYVTGDEDIFISSIKWLTGGFGKLTEAKNELGIDSFVNDKDIYDYLKLWGAFVRIAGFSGMLILLDEMGLLAQSLNNRVARESNYEVILQILNECLQGRTFGIGFLFAGSDFFLDDNKSGLMSNGALSGRLAPNPFALKGLKDFSTPVIRLGEFSPEDLYLLFENIRNVFAMGDRSKYLIPNEAIHSFMNLCAWSLGSDFYRTPREAVKLFTGFLSVLHQNSHVGWRSLLDGTVIEKEPVDELAYGNEETAGLGEVSRTENYGELKPAEVSDAKPAPEVKTEAEPIEAPKPEPVRPEPAFTLASDAGEPVFEPDIIFEFEGDEGTEVAFAPGVKTDGDFEFDFENDPVPRPPGFGMGRGPALFAVKSDPVVYDPDILYILPDSGSSHEVTLRLLETKTWKEPASPPVLGAPSQDEDDMRAGHALYGNENDLKVYLPNMISRNPLMGMERIAPSILNDLVRMSGKILINAYNNYLPNGYEKLLLTVTLVNIAKRWVSDEEKTFWNFIGRQFGFEKSAGETLRGTMCNAIYETMKSHNRFFSLDPKTNKKEFYSSIMAHSLAPRESVFSFFDFLADFYENNLRGLVVRGDPALTSMTDEMQKLFADCPYPGAVALKDKYSGFLIGLVVILRKRPVFFRNFATDILVKLDRLYSGARIENRTYLDELLNCWFQKKNPVPGKPARAAKTQTAMEYGDIRPFYEVTNSGAIELIIPDFRLKRELGGFPDVFAEIVCGGGFSREILDTYGDEFSWTAEGRKISLFALSDFASKEDLRIRVKIFVDGRMAYDSKTSLCREVIAFEGYGEIPVQNMGAGIFSVFTTSDRELSFEASGDDRIVRSASGQMRAVKFSERFGLILDGHIVCSDFKDESVSISVSADPCKGVAYLRLGGEYKVYRGKISLTARVPKAHDLDRYSFEVNGKSRSFRGRSSGGPAEEAGCVLDVTGDMLKDGFLDVVVADTKRTAKEVCRFCCYVIEDLRVVFDRPYYFGGAHDGTGKIEHTGGQAEFGIGEGKYKRIPFGDGELKIKIPSVTWRMEPSLRGGEMTEAGTAVWRGNITDDARIVADCPEEITCRLKISEQVIERAKGGRDSAVFDIGAHLAHSDFTKDEDIVPVQLILDSEDDNSCHDLFSVCLRETFGENPRFEMRDGTLTLKNPQAFLGPDDAKLEYLFKGRKSGAYGTDAKDTVISNDCGLPHGNYHYKIFSLSERPSETEKKVICSGSCILGDVDIFHFDNKLLEIKRVRAEFKEFFILPIYVENLEFSETKEKYKDGVEYPIYRGTCYYLNRDDQKVYFPESFNPVQVVIINGRDVCLYKQDGSKPYLIYESRHKIVDELPENRNGLISYVPDFYEYEALEGH
ncbi:MAG: ATP-binding protein [Synergistaceae bacterium]|jgi:hypothetical protein|nr:ATP-binding protein [Synergistaceae bacterium]